MNQLSRYLVSHAEVVLFIGVFAEQIGLPLPAIPMLLAAGALVADGTLNPVAAVGITVVASVLADWIWFILGRRGGGRLLRFLCKLSLCGGASFAKAERSFSEHATAAVVLAKFFPWLGFLIPPLAGAFGFRTGKFLRFDALGALLYGAFYLGLGFLFDREVSRVMEFLRQYGAGSLTFVSLLAILFVAYKYAHRHKAPVSAPMPPSDGLTSVPRT
jgi:membrane protein DedA with SNARE-associated domain